MNGVTYDTAQQGRVDRLLPDLLRNKGLLRDLVWKELRARYRNAMMGFLWAILQPVLMMLILTFVFGFLLGGIMESRGLRSERPSAAFILCGLVPWQFLSLALTRGISSILENQDLIKKVHFPREVIPLAAILNTGVNLIIGFTTLLIVVAWLEGLGTFGLGFLAIPIIFGILFAMIIGLALLLSALNVHYRDIGYMVEVGLAFGFYASPIVYPLSVVSSRLSPALFNLYMLNPMANLVTAFRQALLDGAMPEPMLIVRAGVFALIVLIAGAWVFRRTAPTFADHL